MKFISVSTFIVLIILTFGRKTKRFSFKSTEYLCLPSIRNLIFIFLNHFYFKNFLDQVRCPICEECTFNLGEHSLDHYSGMI